MSENGDKPSAIEAFLLELQSQGRSAATLELYQCVLGMWERSGLGAVEYLASRGTLSLCSRRYYGRLMKHYLGWSVTKGYMEVNPLGPLRFNQPPATPKQPFSEEEVHRMLAGCTCNRDRTAILILYDTGLRASELAALQRADVNLEAGILHIVAGKGNKGRIVGVASVAVEALRQQLASHDDNAVFPGLNWEKLHRLVKNAGKRAGIQGAHPHRFRHTFAHRFLAAGGDRGDARILLGHTTYKMVDRYAAYYQAERALAAQQRLFSAPAV